MRNSPGDDKQEDISRSLSIDVSDVGKDVASMGRILRAGFDMHFTKSCNKCWMELKSKLSKIDADDPTSKAPLLYLNMKVQPIPEHGRNCECAETEKLVAPLSKQDEIHVGCDVKLAGLITNSELNGMRGRCLGKALTEGRVW